MTTEQPKDAGAPGWRRYRPLVGGLPALVLGLIALWEIAAIARAGSDVPTDDDWRAAGAALRAEHRAGDLIVFAPDWIDPVGRMHLGDLIPVEMAARMDGARYGRIWELSARGARAPETAGLEPVWTETFGELTLRFYEREPAEVVTDFVEAFSRENGPARVALQEVGFEPHRCIWVRPGPNETLAVRFPDAELGRRIVGYVGLADVFTRRDDREPGRLELAVGGEVVAAVEFGNRDGWVRFEAETEPGRAEVELRATAVGADARNRQICVAAEARR